jgi:type IV secretory pathway TraG/TraD family ATPase VirD4
MVVHDTKGDVTQDWPTDDIILLAPHDARSWGWDIGRDIVGELPTFEFAAALIPEPDRDPVWAMGAQHIMTAVLIALQRRYTTAWGWSELYAALQQSPEQLYQMAVNHHPIAAHFLALEGSEYTRTAASYVTTLMAPVARLVQPLAAAWGDLHLDFRLSLKDWISDNYEGPRTIIMQRMPAFPETSRLWIAAAVNHMIGIAGGSGLEEKPDRRIYMCLDEFPQIGKIRSLFDVPATHAAKGVTLALAFQTLGQVRDVYGPNAMGSVDQLTGTKVIFRSQGEDAEYVADKMIGKWRYSAPDRSSNTPDNSWFGNKTVNWRTREENLVLPSYLAGLVPNSSGVEGLVLGLDGGDIYRLSWPYEHWPAQREGNVEAAWISQLPPRPPPAQAKARPVRTRTT